MWWILDLDLKSSANSARLNVETIFFLTSVFDSGIVVVMTDAFSAVPTRIVKWNAVRTLLSQT